jgi:hypothetical protein
MPPVPDAVMVPLMMLTPACVTSAANGEKTTENTQLAPAANGWPEQLSPLLAIAKLRSVKVTTGEASVVLVPDWLVTVTGQAFETAPTPTAGVKFRPGQLKVSDFDSAIPVAVIVAVLAPEVAVKIAEAGAPVGDPTVDGQNCTLNRQVAPCTSVLHVLPVILKFTESDKLITGVAVAPVRFCSVTGQGAVQAPSATGCAQLSPGQLKVRPPTGSFVTETVFEDAVP